MLIWGLIIGFAILLQQSWECLSKCSGQKPCSNPFSFSSMLYSVHQQIWCILSSKYILNLTNSLPFCPTWSRHHFSHLGSCSSLPNGFHVSVLGVPAVSLHTEACVICKSDVSLLLKNLQYHLILLRVKTNTHKALTSSPPTPSQLQPQGPPCYSPNT